MNKFSTFAITLLTMAGADVLAAAKNEPATLKTTVILTAPLPAKEGDPLPADLRELALPAPDKVCGDLILVPEAKAIRSDSMGLKEIKLSPETNGGREKSCTERLAEVVGKKPTVEALRNKMEPELSSVRMSSDWVSNGDKAVTLAELAGLPQMRDADLRLVLAGKSEGISEADIRSAFPDLPETYLVKDISALNKELVKRMCAGEAKSTIESKTVAVIYKPKFTKIDTQTIAQACNNHLIDTGIQFISIAKDKHDAKAKRNDRENAFRLFDKAVGEAQAANACCTKALMNRGLARELLDEPELALRDLEEAEQCDRTDKEVLYNLACHYSKHHSKSNPQLGLALETLEKAVEAGFKDCDQMLKDPDLMNLQKDKSYKERFLAMLHKHGLYCK